MDKKEYIKVLRSVQNSLKTNSRINKQIENFKIDEYYDLMKRTNIRVTSVNLLLSFLSVAYLYEKFDNPFPTTICFAFITFVIEKYIERNQICEKKHLDLQNIKEKYINESKEIEKIEDVIEFINSLTEEEQKKYLNLKI